MPYSRQCQWCFHKIAEAKRFKKSLDPSGNPRRSGNKPANAVTPGGA
jgi:hypothetical protein